MPPPWERYQQQQSQPKQAGPWEQYQQPTRGFVGPLEEREFVGPVQEPGYLSRSGSAYMTFLRELGKTATTKPWEIPGAVRDTAGAMLSGMVAGPVNDFWNAGMEAGEFPTKDVMPTYQPRSDLGKAAVAGIGEVMSPIAAGVDYATDVNNPNPAIRATGRLERGALGVLPFVGARALPKGARGPVKAVPRTAAELRTEAKAAYSRANEAGRGEIVRQDSLGGFTQGIERKLAGEDFAFDPKLEPMTGYAMDMLMEESTKPVVGHSPAGLEIVRRKLLKAEGQAVRAGNGDDARQVAHIIDDFDDWADSLVEGRDVMTSGAKTAESVAARTEARALWSRMKKTQTIETLIERAQNSSPALTQTGLENALRIEFKNLANNQRRMRQFSAEEKAAIQRVARGGVMQQITRRVASLAPRGVVSGAGSAVLGSATGAGAIPFIVAGEAGALAAKLMRLSDVEAARTLISNGQGAAQAATPAFAAPTAGAVRASTVIPPALSAETINRQRNALYRDDDRRNALAR